MSATDWRICAPEFGDPYYFNIVTGETAWEAPAGVCVDDIKPFSIEDEAVLEENPPEEGGTTDVEPSTGAAATVEQNCDADSAETRGSTAVHTHTDTHTDTHTQTCAQASPASLGRYRDYADAFPAWCGEYPSCRLAHAFSRGAGGPRRASDAWERRATASTGMEAGETYYINTITLEQSWTKPEGFLEMEDAVDVTRIMEMVGEDASLSDTIAALGLRPPTAAITEARARLRVGASAHAADDSDDNDVTDLHVALLRLLSVLRFLDDVSIWREVAEMDDGYMPELLASCWTPATPAPTALVICQLLLEFAAASRDVATWFITGRIMEFGSALGASFAGMRAAVYARRAAATASSPAGDALLSPKSAVDVPMLSSFAHFTSVLCIHAAEIVQTNRLKSPAAAASLDTSACSDDVAATSEFTLTETSFPWTAVPALLADALLQAGATAASHLLVTLAALHRLFEAAVLGAEVEGDGGSPSNPFSIFGIVTPVIEALNPGADGAAAAATAHSTRDGSTLQAVMMVIGPESVQLLNTTSAATSLESPAESVASHHRKQSSMGDVGSLSWNPILLPPTPVPRHPWHRDGLIGLLSFTKALLEFPATSKLFYTNDLKVFVDVALRELQDLPAEDHIRAGWIHALQSMLLHSQWYEPHGCAQYKANEIAHTLITFYDVTQAPRGLHRVARSAAGQAIEACKDLLEPA